MTDELAQRRALKAVQKDERVVVNAYGPEGYVLIDVPAGQVQEVIDALTAISTLHDHEATSTAAVRRQVLTEAWQVVDRAIRPLGYGDGASNSPWNEGHERAKDQALNAILALRDEVEQ